MRRESPQHERPKPTHHRRIAGAADAVFCVVIGLGISGVLTALLWFVGMLVGFGSGGVWSVALPPMAVGAGAIALIALGIGFFTGLATRASATLGLAVCAGALSLSAATWVFAGGHWPFIVPSSLVALAALAAGTWTGAGVRRRRRPPGSCPRCGYPRVGLPGHARCPECGSARTHRVDSQAPRRDAENSPTCP